MADVDVDVIGTVGVVDAAVIVIVIVIAIAMIADVAVGVIGGGHATRTVPPPLPKRSPPKRRHPTIRIAGITSMMTGARMRRTRATPPTVKVVDVVAHGVGAPTTAPSNKPDGYGDAEGPNPAPRAGISS